MNAKKTGNFSDDVVEKLKVTSEDIVVNGRIVSISSENTVADASQIWDSQIEANQSTINNNFTNLIANLVEQSGGVQKFDIKVVDALPTSDISLTTIYLVRDGAEETEDMYSEWIYINEKWELLGTQPQLDNVYESIEELYNIVTEKASLKQLGGQKYTYETLKSLRDDGRLVPGAKYILTDYTFIPSTTNWPDTMTCGDGQFDIVLTAVSKNEFASEVMFLHHDDDSYFENQRLEAWKGWYSFNNDESLYPWSSSDGKGVIYRLIDEYKNDIPYDFKHIMFKLDDSSLWNKTSSLTRTLRQMISVITSDVPNSQTYIYTFFDNNDSSADGSLRTSSSFPACVNNSVVQQCPGLYINRSARGRFFNNVFCSANNCVCMSPSYGNVIKSSANTLIASYSCIMKGGYSYIFKSAYVVSKTETYFKGCTYLDCGTISYFTAIGIENDTPSTIDDIVELTVYNSSTNDRTFARRDEDGVVRVYHYNNLLTEHQSLDHKQDKLTAGTNITIDENNVISAASQEFTQVQSDWDETSTSSSAYIKNKPTIPTVPTNVSAFTNDAGYLTSHQSLSGYAKSSDIPTKTSQLTNDSGFLTSHQSLSGYAKTSDIPTKTSQLTNDSGFLTSHQSLTGYAKTSDIPTKTSQLTNDSGFLTSHQSLDGKQDKLTAGDRITISDNIISAASEHKTWTPTYNNDGTCTNLDLTQVNVGDTIVAPLMLLSVTSKLISAVVAQFIYGSNSDGVSAIGYMFYLDEDDETIVKYKLVQKDLALKEDVPEAYTLPKASSDTLGGIKASKDVGEALDYIIDNGCPEVQSYTEGGILYGYLPNATTEYSGAMTYIDKADLNYLTQHAVKSSDSTIKDAVLVSSLPSSPISTTVYFIAE